MPDIYMCEIVQHKRLTDTVFAIAVSCGKLAAETMPGQFIHIKCGEGNLLRRPISVMRINGDTLEFAFEVKGEGTKWFAAREIGEMLDILGPLGNGLALPEGKIIVVGGGIGAPPMLNVAESAKGAVTAVLGFRDKDRVILKSEFEAVCAEVFVTTDDGSFGEKGFVDAPLERLLEIGGYSTVLCCGPQPMLRSVAELCKRYGVPCQVSLEERMGCGVGACLVCACATRVDGEENMSRVCKDGPVFNAEEVVW